MNIKTVKNSPEKWAIFLWKCLAKPNISYKNTIPSV